MNLGPGLACIEREGGVGVETGTDIGKGRRAGDTGIYVKR